MKSALLVLMLACVSVAQTRPEFDVATIKPSPTNASGSLYGPSGGPGSPAGQDPARITMGRMSLRSLIMLAYSVPDFSLTAPDWMAQSRFDVTAKMAEGTTKETYLVMLQNLLADRFHLKLHREMKEMTQFELQVGKGGHKLTENNNGPPPSTGNPYPNGLPQAGPDGLLVFPLGRTLSVHSPGRSQLSAYQMPVQQLITLISNDLRAPVKDGTGLTGKYDFRLNWEGTIMAVPPGATPPDPATLPPPIRIAIQEQLGLRLEPFKGPAEILVVDSADRTPTEN